jgi:hypothetical protein
LDEVREAMSIEYAAKIAAAIEIMQRTGVGRFVIERKMNGEGRRRTNQARRRSARQPQEVDKPR